MMKKNKHPKKAKNLFWNNKKSIKTVIEALKSNFVVISSTDTVYGLLANSTEESALKLHKLKGDRGDKPYVILVENMSKLQFFVDFDSLGPSLIKMIKNCWPGPITLIFRANDSIPDFLCSKERTIAIRCPKHEGLEQILPHFDGLFSTSANKSGNPTPKKADDIDPDLLEKVPFFIDTKDSCDKLKEIAQPSTILNCSQPSKIRVVREGAYPISELETNYGAKFEKISV